MGEHRLAKLVTPILIHVHLLRYTHVIPFRSFLSYCSHARDTCPGVVTRVQSRSDEVIVCGLSETEASRES